MTLITPQSRRVAVYVPHGAVPSKRGFAPSIVAHELARHYEHWSPYFFCAKEGMPAFERSGQMTFSRFSSSRLYNRLFKKITRLDPWPLHARLASRMRPHSPDILHVHQLEFPVQAFREHYRKRVPIIVHAHLTAHTPGAMLADRYIAVSQYVKEVLVKKGYPESRIEVISNGVNLDVFAAVTDLEKDRLRQSHGIDPRVPTLLFFGRKQLVKGFDVFLNVAEILVNVMGQVQILAIGSEPDDSICAEGFQERKRQRARLMATGKYKELGPLPQPELARWLATSDVALLPSSTEPQGMAMLEAMASGCLTISNAVGGIVESIQHGKTGWLLNREESVEKVAALTKDILESRLNLYPIREAAIDFVRKNHDWRVLASRHERLYDQVIATSEG